MPRSPKGRAVARGLDAGLHLQHAFMPAGYASLKTAQVNQKCRLTVITVSTAERTLHPARMFTESLTPRPELENSLDPEETARPTHNALALPFRRGKVRLSPRNISAAGRSRAAFLIICAND